MRDPIDEAALAILRPLLADLEAGRVLVRCLRAHDTKHQGLTVTWAPRAGAPPAALDHLPDTLPDPGVRCPRGCDVPLDRFEDGALFCPGCEAELPSR